MTAELCIRGVSSLPQTAKVTFLQAVPHSLQCNLCHNLSTELLRDSDDHAYCQSCINMLNEDGTFTCVVDEAVEDIRNLRPCTDGWGQVLDLIVNCPKQKVGCKFQASLRDLLVHYPNCQRDRSGAVSDMVDCPLCKRAFDAKELTAHMTDECKERLLECSFCEGYFKEWTLDEHMSICDERPETCEFCGTQFETFAELRDNHYDVCVKKPVDCPYMSFGCGFQGLRKELSEHLSNSLDIHTTTLVQAMVDVMQDIKGMKKEVMQLRAQVAAAENIKEVKGEIRQLRNKIGEVQNTQSETLQHRLTMEDKVNMVSERLQTLERTTANVAKDAATGAADRLAELETRVNELSEPMHNLLRNVAEL